MIEKIKKIAKISKSKNIILVIGIVAAFLLIIYFKLFFTKGIYYDDVFLKKNTTSSETSYSGSSVYGDIHIIVKEKKDKQIEVIYNLPGNITRRYTVEFTNNNNNNDQDFEPIVIRDKDENIILEGLYRSDSFFLLDNNGEPAIDQEFLVTFNGNSPYDESYEVSLKNVADLATFSDDTIRGRFGFLVIAILLFAITMIDIRFPLFFFQLRYAMSVNDPEPSDLYLLIQKVTRVLYPIIGIYFMIYALSGAGI